MKNGSRTAEKTFQKMIEQFPDDRDVYFFLGKVYLENHKYQQAIKVFEDLLSRQTDSAALVHVELGNIYHASEGLRTS